MKNELTRDLKPALYCASILIGAALLTMPLRAAHLGFGPLLVAIVLVGLWMIWINQRITTSLFAHLVHRSDRMARVISWGLGAARGGDGPAPLWLDARELMRDEARLRGARQWVDQVSEAGIGRPGRSCILLGTFLYAFFADIGYLILGSRSLSSLATFAGEFVPESLGLVLALGLGLIVAGLRFESIFARPFLLRGTCKKLCVMFGAWLSGIAVIGLTRRAGHAGAAGDGGEAEALLTVLLFALAVLAALLTRGGTGSTSKRDDLSDQHTVNVLVVSFEIVLLLTTIGITLYTVIRHGIVVPIEIMSPQALTPGALGDWASMLGLVIFAYVSTGHLNLCCYPALFETLPGHRTPRLARVMVLGTLIPMLVYLAWALTSAVTLEPAALAQLDASKEYTTIGIARLFVGIDPASAFLITFFGYSVALLAVTSTCNAFTESLAGQVGVFLRDAGVENHLTRDPENLWLHLLILLAALPTAFAIDRLIQISISTILAVAGIAGGGLLVLILPFFLPPAGRPKSTWASIMVAFASAIVLTLLGLNAANLPSVHDAAGAVVAGISVVIALSILGMTIWLIRSEPGADLKLSDTIGDQTWTHV